MIYPIQTFFELAQKVTRAMVSARKAVAIFEHVAAVARPGREHTAARHADLYDELSGFVARDGELTIVVCGVPEETSALADRLGRYLPADTEPVSQELDEDIKGRAARRARAQRLAERARLAALDEELANREWGVRLGGVDLGAASLDDVRRQILVSDTGSQLFAGTLQDAIDPHGRLTRAQAEEAVRVANAEDVYDALPGGWQGCSTSVAADCPVASANGSCSPGRSLPRHRSWCWSSPPRRWTPTPRRGSPHASPPYAAGGPPWSAPCRRCGCTTPTGSCCSRTAG